MLSPSLGPSVPQKMIIFTLTTVRTSDLKMNSPECHLCSLNSSKENNIFCSFMCLSNRGETIGIEDN